MNRRQRGFSLIEVMVALVVMSIGLLGIAKMQAAALSNTAIASTRSLAAIEVEPRGFLARQSRVLELARGRSLDHFARCDRYSQCGAFG